MYAGAENSQKHPISLYTIQAIEYLVLSDVWQTASEVFSNNKCVATMMADKSLQSQIAALDPRMILALDSRQIQKDLTVELLSKLPEAVRLVLLCLRFLRSAAVTQGHQACLTQDGTVDKTLVKLYRLRFPDEETVPAARTGSVPNTLLSRYVSLLRSALLVTKAAIVSVEVCGNPPKPYSAKRALWNTVHSISEQMHVTAVGASEKLTEIPEPDSALAADIDQAQHLSSLLIQLIIPVLKHHLQANGVLENQPKYYMPVVCCTILDSMLTRTRSPVMQQLSQTVAAALLKSGQLAKRFSFSRCLCPPYPPICIQ